MDIAESPESPVLSMPKSNLTSADMYALVNGALDKQRKQDIYSSVNLNRSDIPALQQQNNEVTTTTTTTETENNQQVTVTTTTTTDYKSLSVQNNNALGPNVSDIGQDVYEHLRKHFHGKHIPFTLSMVQAFCQQCLMSGTLLSIMPTLKLLQSQTNPPLFSTDKGHVDVASSTSFASVISKSGPEIDGFTQLLFPDDPKTAKDLANSSKSQLLSVSLQGVGQSLGLPGLHRQVDGQAKLVRDSNSALHDVAFRRGVVPGLTDTVMKQDPRLSRSEVQHRIEKALEHAAAEGDFNTRQELQSALRESFKKAFPGQTELADSLTRQAEGDALEAALSGSGNQFGLPFNAAQLNVAAISASIINVIQEQFARSDREIHAQTIADDIAHAIKKEAIDGQLTSAQSVRDAIKTQLEQNGFSAADAGKIAAQVNLGLPTPAPLAEADNDGLLSPDDFRRSVHETLISRNISPDSPLGQSVGGLLGISDAPSSTNVIGMINADYRAGQLKGDNYLNLDPSRKAIKQELDFLDPGKKLVIEWSAVMNGTPDHENHKRTSNNIV